MDDRFVVQNVAVVRLDYENFTYQCEHGRAFALSILERLRLTRERTFDSSKKNDANGQFQTYLLS